MRFLLALLLCVPTVAHAGYLETTYAQVLRIDEHDIVQLAGFDLPAGSAFNRVLVGRYKHGEYISTEMVLLACGDTKCDVRTVWLDVGELEALHLVDLATPGSLPTTYVDLPRDRGFHELDKTPTRRGWPALVVRTTQMKAVTTQNYTMHDVSGTETSAHLSIISLARADAANPQVLNELVEDRWPTGVGHTLTFEVAANKELVATEQRSIDNQLACIRPKPTKIRYVLDAHRRFHPAPSLRQVGC